VPTRVFPLVFLIAFPGHSQRPSNNLTFGGSGNDSINATAVARYRIRVGWAHGLPVPSRSERSIFGPSIHN
jgi:hypothetical protein